MYSLFVERLLGADGRDDMVSVVGDSNQKPRNVVGD